MVEREYRKQLNNLKICLKKRGISAEVSQKILKYFEYMHEQKQQSTVEGDQVLGQLPQSLKVELAEDINFKMLNAQPSFKKNFSQEFLKQLSVMIREKQYSNEQLVYEQEYIPDAIYFVFSGKVKMLRRLNNNKLSLFSSHKRGEVFGQYTFFSNRPLKMQAITKQTSVVGVLTKSDFLSVLRQFPQDYEKYRIIADTFEIYNHCSVLNIRCSICKSHSHTLVQDCPFVNAKFDREVIIKKYIKQDVTQKRARCPRYLNKTPNVLSQLEAYRNSAIKLILNSNTDHNQVYDILENLYENYQESLPCLPESEEDLLSNAPRLSRRQISSPATQELTRGELKEERDSDSDEPEDESEDQESKRDQYAQDSRAL